MRLALIGLSQPGKSTLVSALTGRAAELPGMGKSSEVMVPVPDPRLDWLTGIYKPEKTIPAAFACMELPSFDLREDSGRTAARKLLEKTRTCDLLVCVVRGFSAPAVAPYRDRIDPKTDLAELAGELLFADLGMVATRIENLEKQVKKPTTSQQHDKEELELMRRIQAGLENEQPVRKIVHSSKDLDITRPMGFLTAKPVLAMVNINEDEAAAPPDLSGCAGADVPVISLCAKIESELAQLDATSRAEFMRDLGLPEPAAGRFARSCFDALGLCSFLTVGRDEVRAWPIRKGTIAHKAAGVIHSDLERGFIRAEVFSYDDIKTLGSEKALKEAGKMRLEGKEYVVKDGDIISIRFSV
jgi:ribosome-binding ATPase